MMSKYDYECFGYDKYCILFDDEELRLDDEESVEKVVELLNKKTDALNKFSEMLTESFPLSFFDIMRWKLNKELLDVIDGFEDIDEMKEALIEGLKHFKEDNSWVEELENEIDKY